MEVSRYALLGADDQPICDYDGILEVTKVQTSQVLTEPIENGELAAFNKTQAPDSVKVSLSLGYDPAKQTVAMGRLKALKQGVGSQYLCKLVSPEDVTESLALETIGTAHTSANGATLLTVELSFIRIRAVQVSVSASRGWTPKNASAAQPVNGGRVQPKKQSTLVKLNS